MRKTNDNRLLKPIKLNGKLLALGVAVGVIFGIAIGKLCHSAAIGVALGIAVAVPFFTFQQPFFHKKKDKDEVKNNP
jgi:hypothetical protein